jgi:hypothetical protein
MAKYASKIVEQMEEWIGRNEYDGSHKAIIDIYNSQKHLPRGYKVKYTDAWCATTVCAAFLNVGYSALIPMECSCGNLIELAKVMGIFQEADGYVPSPGDILLYDWSDNGVGDNKGWPDHVGVVKYVGGGKMTIVEGNYKNAVNIRQIDINGKYIRGFICPRYDIEEEPKKGEKSIEEIAKEVIRGLWGNGHNIRRPRLEAAGYDYEEVKKMVNKLYR